jgi:AraC-like DNA-binding protein
VLVIARLKPEMLDRLRTVVGRDHVIVPVGTWSALVAALHMQAIEAAVLDVATVAGAATDDITVAQAVRALVGAGVPALVYTVLTPETAGHLRTLIDCGVRHYMFKGIDDQPSRFRERLETVRLDGLENRVLAPLLEALASRSAPMGMLTGIRALFRTPDRFRTAEDLAAATGYTRSYVNRLLEEAALGSSKTLVHAAHALHAYQFARCPGATAVRVAERLRYTNATMFRRQLRQFTGLPYSRWRDQGPEQCVAAIRRRLGLVGHWTQLQTPQPDDTAPLRLVGTAGRGG